MTYEESKLLHAATPRIYRLIVGALETGCRLGELLALRWQEVDLERRELLVKAEHAKDGQDRVLPISTRLAAVLELARLDPNGRELPADAFVCGDEVGRHVTTFKNAWQVTLLRASGYQPEWTKGRLTDACRQRIAEFDLHFHDLRHEAGSRWVEGGMPLHHVKELLGHANIQDHGYVPECHADRAPGIDAKVRGIPKILHNACTNGCQIGGWRGEVRPCHRV